MPDAAKAAACLQLAKCDKCPLGDELRKRLEFGPVPAEINDTDIIIVGDAPGKQEDTIKMPFIGPQGHDLLVMLEGLGHDRDSVSWTNQIKCRYPNDDPKGFYARLKKRNDRRAAKGQMLLPRPESCCRPALDAELALHDKVITLGSAALRAVGVTSMLTGVVDVHPKLPDNRGAPGLTGDGKKMIATRLDWQRDPKWKVVVEEDFARAFRHFADELDWTAPELLFQPTADQLRAFIAEMRGKPMVADVETAPWKIIDDRRFFDAQFDDLRCVGLGNRDAAVVIPLIGVDGKRRFYTEESEREVREVLAAYFADTEFLKIGHNFGYYDTQVIENHFGVVPRPVLDTHPLGKLADAEYPKGLGFIVSRYTDSPAWKSEHTATEAETDEELAIYNANDCGNNERIIKPLLSLAKKRQQHHLYRTYARLQQVCVQMHRAGLLVDERRRKQHEDEQYQKMLHYRAEIKEALGEDINPRSSRAVGNLLFQDWALPVQDLTASGEPSTSDGALLKLLASPIPTAKQKNVIMAIRKYRTAGVLISNFLAKWERGGGFVHDVNDPGGNGMIYPDYNPAGTVGWRFSCFDPNLQNVKYTLRDCFVCPDGYTYVYADYDALELKMVAAMAGVRYYLDAWDSGSIDAHNLTGTLVYGNAWWKLEGSPVLLDARGQIIGGDKTKKGDGVYKVNRDIIKRFIYQFIYGGSAVGIHAKLIEAEDNDGELIFIDKPVRFVRSIRSRLLRAAPEFEAWWHSIKKKYRGRGFFVEEPVWGLRRYFPAGSPAHEAEREAINFLPQGGGGAVVHTGMFNVLDAWDWQDGETICHQGHDSLTFRIKTARAEAFKQCLLENLVVRVDSLPGVTFTAEAKIGPNLMM